MQAGYDVREISPFWYNMQQFTARKVAQEVQEEQEELGMMNYCTPRMQHRIDNFNTLISKVTDKVHA